MYGPNSVGPFVVYVQNKDTSIAIHPLEFGRRLHSAPIPGIDVTKSEGRNKISVSFKNYKAANNFITSPFLNKYNMKGFIPTFKTTKIGVIRGVIQDISVEDIVTDTIIPINSGKILKARRLNRKIMTDNGPTWKPSQTIVLTFEGQTLPQDVRLYHNLFRVEQYIFPTVMCYKCCHYGHTRLQCRATTSRCPKCAETHSGEMCSTELLKCANCNGNHAATDQNCPELRRQKDVKKTMADKNVSYREALASHPRGLNSYAKITSSYPSTIPTTSTRVTVVKPARSHSPKRSEHTAIDKKILESFTYKPYNSPNGSALQKSSGVAEEDQISSMQMLIEKISLFLLQLISNSQSVSPSNADNIISLINSIAKHGSTEDAKNS
jgi:hypothetical protein